MNAPRERKKKCFDVYGALVCEICLCLWKQQRKSQRKTAAEHDVTTHWHTTTTTTKATKFTIHQMSHIKLNEHQNHYLPFYCSLRANIVSIGRNCLSSTSEIQREWEFIFRLAKCTYMFTHMWFESCTGYSHSVKIDFRRRDGKNCSLGLSILYNIVIHAAHTSNRKTRGETQRWQRHLGLLDSREIINRHIKMIELSQYIVCATNVCTVHCLWQSVCVCVVCVCVSASCRLYRDHHEVCFVFTWNDICSTLVYCVQQWDWLIDFVGPNFWILEMAHEMKWNEMSINYFCVWRLSILSELYCLIQCEIWIF